MSAKSYAKGDRTVTVTPDLNGLRVQRDGGLLPVRLVTSRPDDYAAAIDADLTASGYQQVTS